MPLRQGSLLPVNLSNSLLALSIASGPFDVPLPQETVFSRGIGRI